MTKHLHHKLLKKGWTLEEIKRLSDISKQAHESRTPFIKFLDKSVFWLFLAVAIVGNTIVSIILIPFMVYFTGVPLYTVIVILGLGFGIFLDMLIHDMEHLTTKHHVMAGLFILGLAVVTLVYMPAFASNFIRIAGLDIEQRPMTIGIVYTVALIIPYISTKLIRFKK